MWGQFGRSAANTQKTKAAYYSKGPFLGLFMDEPRLTDETFQSLVSSAYQFHEDEEFKVDYWARAMEVACGAKESTTLRV